MISDSLQWKDELKDRTHWFRVLDVDKITSITTLNNLRATTHSRESGFSELQRYFKK